VLTQPCKKRRHFVALRKMWDHETNNFSSQDSKPNLMEIYDVKQHQSTEYNFLKPHGLYIRMEITVA
jgi:hypothetical protein